MKVTISENKLERKTFTGLKFNKVECSPADLKGFIEEGRVFTYNQKEDSFTHKGHDYRGSYDNTEIIIVDIDKVDYNFSEMIDKCSKMTYKPYLIHTTFSNQTEKKDFKYCYHLVYVLSKPVYNSTNFNTIYSEITRDYSELVDLRADDCNRIMYSSNKSLSKFNLKVLGNITNLEEIKYTESKTNDNIVTKIENPDLTGIDKDFIKELDSKTRSSFVKKHIYDFVRETQVEYDEWGYADLTGIEFYKVYDKHVFKNNEVTINKVTSGHRANQLMVDGFYFLKANPNMTIEKLITALVCEVYYYYDNEDNEFTNYRIIEIARYCFTHNNFVKPIKKSFKIDTTLYKQRFFVKGIKAVKLAQKYHNNSVIGELYDWSKDIYENSKELGIDVRRLKRFMKDNGVDVEVKQRDKYEDSELVKLYNPNLSLRKNAEIMNCSYSTVKRLINKYKL